MHSLKTKIAAATISGIVITMIIAAVFGIAAIRNIGAKSSEQMLLLLCEAGQKNLDASLLEVEQDVGMISAYVESDLDGLDDQRLQAQPDTQIMRRHSRCHRSKALRSKTLNRLPGPPAMRTVSGCFRAGGNM